ncbi:MAG: c-type cytochrome [Bryobacteraceae bacterium]|nr:c-type cytochrome [Bryobacteraceae bacterium]MDW8377490.1 c-type cytochrome [Bryobacterales bacterium]
MGLNWRLGILALPVLLAGQSAHDPVPDIPLGKRIFESQCAVCHGQDGSGGRGPALNRPTLLKAPDDQSLRRAIAEGLPPEMPGAWQLSVREVASVAAYVRSLGSVPVEPLKGDPTRGKLVYQSKGCASCHIIQGQGRAHGPELTAIGAKRNAAFLREAIRNPAAELAEDYLLVEIETRSGQRIRGVRLSEDPFTIQLRDTAQGRFHSFRKNALKDVRRLLSESSMPAYDEASLPAAELEDLVAYLATLRGGPQ